MSDDTTTLYFPGEDIITFETVSADPENPLPYGTYSYHPGTSEENTSVTMKIKTRSTTNYYVTYRYPVKESYKDLVAQKIVVNDASVY